MGRRLDREAACLDSHDLASSTGYQRLTAMLKTATTIGSKKCQLYLYDELHPTGRQILDTPHEDVRKAVLRICLLSAFVYSLSKSCLTCRLSGIFPASFLWVSSIELIQS